MVPSIPPIPEISDTDPMGLPRFGAPAPTTGRFIVVFAEGYRAMDERRAIKTLLQA